jgi:hypothetical protein
VAVNQPDTGVFGLEAHERPPVKCIYDVDRVHGRSDRDDAEEVFVGVDCGDVPSNWVVQVDLVTVLAPAEQATLFTSVTSTIDSAIMVQLLEPTFDSSVDLR